MLINVCLWSKRATSYRIYESQNGLSELLQASYITVIKTDSLNFFTCFTEVKTDSPNLYKLPTRFAVALMDSPRIYKHPTLIAVVKTDSPIFYILSTYFGVIKTDSPGFHEANPRFAVTLRSSTSLLHTLLQPLMSADYHANACKISESDSNKRCSRMLPFVFIQFGCDTQILKDRLQLTGPKPVPTSGSLSR